ncbi:hypothetical protein AX767_07440 [Variovorax sp. PAMC 28711]|nr:hypothetical protein AX767_07440 [Variovorax sp. PAMC 28711]
MGWLAAYEYRTVLQPEFFAHLRLPTDLSSTTAQSSAGPIMDIAVASAAAAGEAHRLMAEMLDNAIDAEISLSDGY